MISHAHIYIVPLNYHLSHHLSNHISYHLSNHLSHHLSSPALVSSSNAVIAPGDIQYVVEKCEVTNLYEDTIR